ncbi:unnamed protein product [Mesocestoides corti]|uniref:Uncharacterized protein n=1 Tax=Mesocestoides corti TaxID=53468 RepID=A0A0R3UKH2_MESCO|nr:unnamed protein product [Mesocestoides corti]
MCTFAFLNLLFSTPLDVDQLTLILQVLGYPSEGDREWIVNTKTGQKLGDTNRKTSPDTLVDAVAASGDATTTLRPIHGEKFKVRGAANSSSFSLFSMKNELRQPQRTRYEILSISRKSWTITADKKMRHVRLPNIACLVRTSLREVAFRSSRSGFNQSATVVGDMINQFLQRLPPDNIERRIRSFPSTDLCVPEHHQCSASSRCATTSSCGNVLKSARNMKGGSHNAELRDE